MKKLASLTAASCIIIFSHQTCSADTGMKSAIADYKHGKYLAALGKFQTIEKADATNVNAHYYAAMCYQCLGKNDSAKGEYRWVFNNAQNPAKEYARVGLARLGEDSTVAVNANSDGGKQPSSLFATDIPAGFAQSQNRMVPLPPPVGRDTVHH